MQTIAITCAWCGKEATVRLVGRTRTDRRFCSRACSRAYNNSPAGQARYVERRKTYRRKLYVPTGTRPVLPNAVCQVCGKEFHVSPSELAKGHGKCCSRACDAKRRSISCSGPNSPRWKGGPEKWQRADRGGWIDCAGCGERVWATDKRFRYCSVACHHRSTAKRGPDNPAWAGGKKPRNWKESLDWREAVLRRDGWTCQHCGSREGLNAHHIKRWIDYPDLRYEVSNGITLCRPCHDAVHRGQPRRRIRTI